MHKISKSSMTVLLFISGNTNSRMIVSRISQQENKDGVNSKKREEQLKYIIKDLYIICFIESSPVLTFLII